VYSYKVYQMECFHRSWKCPSITTPSYSLTYSIYSGYMHQRKLQSQSNLCLEKCNSQLNKHQHFDLGVRLHRRLVLYRNIDILHWRHILTQFPDSRPPTKVSISQSSALSNLEFACQNEYISDLSVFVSVGNANARI
jgi:hypothetical protein